MPAKSSFYATTGPDPDQLETLASMITAAEAAQAAAEAAQAAAEAAQAAAETAQTGAETAETHAETAETNAETAETNAETAETNAETAETNAELAQAAAEAAQAAAEAAAAVATRNVVILTSVSGADTITAQAVTEPIAAYVTGYIYMFQAADTNTGAATIDIDTVGPVALEKYGAALAAGDQFAGTWYAYLFDGIAMQMILSGAML